MKKISVIMPVCDEPPFIRDAVESALFQTWKDVEVIAVIDGSSGSAAKAIADFIIRGRVVCVRHDGTGLAAARNAGLRAATGGYIAMLDADCLWEPRKLEKQVGFLESEGADAVFTEAGPAPAAGGPRCLTPVRTHGGGILDRLLRGPAFAASSVLMRREAIEAAGFLDESFWYLEDWDWWMRMQRKVKTACLPEYLVTKRVTCASGTDGFGFKYEYYLRIYEKHSRFYGGAERRVLRRGTGRECYYYALKLMKNGLPEAAARAFLTAVRMNPGVSLRLPELLKAYIEAGKAAPSRACPASLEDELLAVNGPADRWLAGLAGGVWAKNSIFLYKKAS